MLYSIGKDSAVMLHLAVKAFYPGAAAVSAAARRHDLEVPRDVRVPRRRGAARSGMRADRAHQPGRARRTASIRSRTARSVHTDIMKTQALKQALDKYGFDAAFGGARRDEEKIARQGAHLLVPQRRSTAGTRRTSARSCGASTTRASDPGESMRVFPLSNWTELDVWQYIYLENIPIVPLYFAAERPVVERDGALIMVDDERMPLQARREPAHDARCASARSAAIR